jgi:hypothetical protein
MPANILDKITGTSAAGIRPVATTVTSTRAGGVTTLQVAALTGWETTTAVHFATYRTDTAGNKVAGSQIDWKGIVNGTQITNLTVTAGTDTGNTIGDTVVCMPTAAWADDLHQGLSVGINPDGSFKSAAVLTALNSGSTALNGWNALGYTFSTVTYNGNRSYTGTITAQDVTTTLSPGMRLRTTRTVAAPTQCTTLNGTNQYWSKTSPAGMTFTDDFTVSAWVKLASYPSGQAGIVGRFDGTNGWLLDIFPSGKVRLYGGAGATTRALDSFQSIPLNKWVHIAASLDMSAGSGAIYIDGVLVPSTVSGALTSLTQAGSLQVGAYNGSAFFPGKIAQAAVFSSVLSAATIQSYYSQGLTGAETSLISAYSFNGVATDLNTTNANNLTAFNAATATNADSPFGGQADGTISSTLDYAIVQKATFSTNSTIVFQVPEGCTVPTSGGVASVVYSSNKAPFGMPTETSKWSVESLILSQQSTAVASATWANVASFQISAPIGAWNLGYSVASQINLTTAAGVDLFATLSTTTTTETNKRFTSSANLGVTTAASYGTTLSKEHGQNLAAPTTYYLNGKSGAGTYFWRGDNAECLIFAKNAYL